VLHTASVGFLFTDPIPKGTCQEWMDFLYDAHERILDIIGDSV